MSQESLTFQDKRGQSLQVGDIIVYGHALGRCAGLRYGKVLGFAPHKNHHQEDRLKVHVIGVDDDWSHRAPELLTRKSYLLFPSRILVMNRDQIPDDIFDLLDNYTD